MLIFLFLYIYKCENALVEVLAGFGKKAALITSAL